MFIHKFLLKKIQEPKDWQALVHLHPSLAPSSHPTTNQYPKGTNNFFFLKKGFTYSTDIQIN